MGAEAHLALAEAHLALTGPHLALTEAHLARAEALYPGLAEALYPGLAEALHSDLDFDPASAVGWSQVAADLDSAGYFDPMTAPALVAPAAVLVFQSDRGWPEHLPSLAEVQAPDRRLQ